MHDARRRRCDGVRGDRAALERTLEGRGPRCRWRPARSLPDRADPALRAVGGASYVFNLGTYSLFLWVGLPYLLAATVSFLIGFAFNFLANRHWTFVAGGTQAGGQFMRFSCVAALVLGLDLALLRVAVEVPRPARGRRPGRRDPLPRTAVLRAQPLLVVRASDPAGHDRQREAPLQLARADIGERERELVLEVLDSNILALGPMHAALRGGVRGLLRHAPRRRRLERHDGPAPRHAPRRHRGRATRSSPRRSASSPRPTPFSTRAPCRSSPTSTSARSTSTPTPSRRSSRRARARSCRCTSSATPATLEPLQAIADRHGLAIVEDACEALGATHGGRRVASFGNPAVFGFYPNKQMTTGEGGMVTTDDDELAAHAARARQPGPLGRRRLARARPSRLQLPHGRALGRRRPRARPSACRNCSPNRAAVAARYGELLGDSPRRRAALRGHRRRRALVVRLRAAGWRPRSTARRSWSGCASRACPASPTCRRSTCSPSTATSATARASCRSPRPSQRPPSRSRSTGR